MIKEGHEWTVFYEQLVEARLAALETLREDSEIAIDFYNGIQKPYMDDYFEDVFENWADVKARIPLKVLPLTEAVIDGLSKLYKCPPKRTLINKQGIEDQGATEIYSKLTEYKNIDMKVIDRYTRLTKTILVHPWWREGEGMKYRIFTPDLCDVDQDRLNPQQANIVVYRSSKPDTDPSLTEGDYEDYFIYWDRDNTYMINEEGFRVENPENPNGKNPYGILPFTTFRDKRVIGNLFWQNIDEVFVNMNQAVNALATDLSHVCRMQSFAQPVIRGDVKASHIQLDPMSILMLPTGNYDESSQPDFFFRSPDAKITELRETINWWIETGMYLKKLGAKSMTAQSQVASGFAILASKLDLLEDRQDRIELFSMPERELFKVERAIYNYHAGFEGLPKIPEDLKLKIDWPDLSFPISKDEEIKWDEHRLKYNLVNNESLLREKNPDIANEDEAKLIVEANKKVNEENKTRFGTGRFEKAAEEKIEEEE